MAGVVWRPSTTSKPSTNTSKPSTPKTGGGGCSSCGR